MEFVDAFFLCPIRFRIGLRIVPRPKFPEAMNLPSDPALYFVITEAMISANVHHS